MARETGGSIERESDDSQTGRTFADLVKLYSRTLFVKHRLPTICGALALFCGWLARGIDVPHIRFWLIVAFASLATFAVCSLYGQILWARGRKETGLPERTYVVSEFHWGEWTSVFQILSGGRFSVSGYLYPMNEGDPSHFRKLYPFLGTLAQHWNANTTSRAVVQAATGDALGSVFEKIRVTFDLIDDPRTARVQIHPDTPALKRQALLNRISSEIERISGVIPKHD